MKEIRLTQGLVTFVSDEDYEQVSKFKWCAMKRHNKHELVFYAVKGNWIKGKGAGKLIYLHKFIIGIVPENCEVDHKDRNSLNNCRQNLRIVTHIQNTQNSSKRKKCTSIYKGASFEKRTKKWISHITVNKKVIHLGCFDTALEAAQSYDVAAIKNFGEYANVNKY